jgi:hypothetical protein
MSLALATQSTARCKLCFASPDFDSLKRSYFQPPSSSALPHGVSDIRGADAALAWRGLVANGVTGCKLPCSQMVYGNKWGFGSYFTSLMGGARKNYAKGVMPSNSPLPDALLRRPLPNVTTSDHSLERGMKRLFSSSACATRMLTCFLTPLTQADTADNARPPSVDKRACAKLHTPCENGTIGSKVQKQEATEQLKRGGLFWNVAAQASRMLRPSSALAKLLVDERVAMGLPSTPSAPSWNRLRPMLGMHMRHGDSCRDGVRTGRICSAAEVYARAAAEMAAQYKYRSLFVATDSDGALAALRASLPAAGWPTDAPVFVRRDRQRKDVNRRAKRVESQFADGSIDSWSEFYSFIVDVLLLGDSDGLVGKFTSNMDRVAYALMAGRVSAYRPYISLDSAWCFGGLGYSKDSVRNFSNTTGMGSFKCNT